MKFVGNIQDHVDEKLLKNLNVLTVSEADKGTYGVEENLDWNFKENELELVEAPEMQIEKLQTELKNKQSRIDYLEGQISVYKKYMFNESEEN